MGRDKWIKIRRKINRKYDYDDNWESAIQLFEKRINERYFDTIKQLLDEKKFKGEGFPIVTVQCALIETFAAFKRGKIHNSNYQENEDPDYQYGNSGEIFKEFLLEEEIFKNNFYVNENGKKEKNKPFKADDFYKNVRCGLVHETRTRKNWVIRVKKSYKDNVFLTLEGNNKIIYRTNLHRQLKEYFKTYLNDLRRDENRELRKYFARKLDHIYEVNRRGKRGYDWWQII